MRTVLGMEATEMADVFDEWNRGDLESFLIEITAKILRVNDPETKKPTVAPALDVAGEKGTGTGRPRVCPERDHGESPARQRPGDEEAARRPRLGRGRPEGHGQVDFGHRA